MDVKVVLWIASSTRESLFKKFETQQKQFYKTGNHFLHDHVQQTQKKLLTRRHKFHNYIK